MRKPIVIYGAGGLGREVLSLCRATEAWDVIGFIDDQKSKHDQVNGIQVLGNASVLREFDKSVQLVFAIGDPVAKKKLVRSAHHNMSLATLTHPSAIIQDESRVRMGGGSIICAGVILTTDILLEEHVLINLNATIGHDCKVGAYSAIMPGVNIGGHVTLGESVLVGSGANILNGIMIGAHSKIGMGAVVIQHVASATTVVGVPAKPTRA